MLSKTHINPFVRRMTVVLALALTVFCIACPMTATAAPTDSVDEDGTQLRIGPVLMVTDYTVVEGERDPGSSFLLKMNIANLSEHASAHNVVATLTIENVSVSLQEGYTNQLYIHEIRPQETVSIQFPLEVYSYCAEENMILSMTMTCYDDAAVHYDFQTMMTPDIDVVRTLNISSLTVPDGVERIGIYAFSACGNLTSVSLPNTLKEIAAAAIIDNNLLEIIEFRGTVAEWENIVKDDHSIEMGIIIQCVDGQIVIE